MPGVVGGVSDSGVGETPPIAVTPRSGWLFVLAMRLFPSIVEARMAAINGTA